MTDEQKFIFDLKGYLLLPEVLTTSEVDEIKFGLIRSHYQNMKDGSLVVHHPY